MLKGARHTSMESKTRLILLAVIAPAESAVRLLILLLFFAGRIGRLNLPNRLWPGNGAEWNP